MISARKILALQILVLSPVAIAQAQERDAQPSSVMETYDSWTVACDNIEIPAAPEKGEGEKAGQVAEKAGTKRFCEAYQTYMNLKSKQELARFFFAYVGIGDNAPGLQGGIRTLVDVSFHKTPVVSDADKTILEGKLARCAGAYCYIEFDFDDAALKQLEEAQKPQFAYPLSSGRMIRIGMSSRGLAAAIKSLQAKQDVQAARK